MKRLDFLVSPDKILKNKVALDTLISGLSHHSQSITPKNLFFALKGSLSDGHLHVGSVLEKGAVAVIVEREAIFASHPATILVHSSRDTLAHAAARWFGDPSKAFRLVGITGTNGKTTSAYLLRSIWDHFGFVSGMLGTVESRIGKVAEPAILTTPDPLSLQSLFHRIREGGGSYAVAEVSSIALDQHRVEGSCFEVALFTNLTQDHLDYHGDMEQYYRAKLRLFRDFSLNAAVINIDDPWGKRLLKEGTARRTLSFSLEAKGSDFSVGRAQFTKEGTRAFVHTPEGEMELQSPLIGKHNLSNCLGVLGVTFALGLDLKTVVSALRTARGAPGRLERIPLGDGYPQVFVDYAHSDDALRNVLLSLSELNAEEGRRIFTVFGAGGDRDRSKRPKMAAVVSVLSHVAIATSDNPRTEDPEAILNDIEKGISKDKTEYHREPDRKKAIVLALSLAGPHDLVLIAGKGHENYQILGRNKIPFDDREVVLEFYREFPRTL